MPSLLLRNGLRQVPVSLLDQAVSLREWLNGGWGLLFSDPQLFTPPQLSARGGVARLQAELARRNIRVLGVADSPYDNEQDWISLVNESEPFVFLSSGRSPLGLDGGLDGGEAAQAERVLQSELETLRRPYAVIVDAQARSRAAIDFRAGLALNFSEVLRVVDLLQDQDTFRASSQANSQGDPLRVGRWIAGHPRFNSSLTERAARSPSRVVTAPLFAAD